MLDVRIKIHFSHVRVKVRPSFSLQTPSEGADSILYLALSPSVERETGGYYDNCRKLKTCQLSYSDSVIEQMYILSTDMIQVRVNWIICLVYVCNLWHHLKLCHVVICLSITCVCIEYWEMLKFLKIKSIEISFL